MSKSIMLNRKQIEKLNEICNHFKEINNFKVESNNSSGIGVNITVTFALFEKQDTNIDITDYEDW